MNKQDIVSRVLIFIAMLIIIALAYPHKSGSFSYHFEEGRPWNHGLITAQYDFPVYKSEEQIKQEKAEALSKFAPYFTLNSRVAREQTTAAENAAKGVLTKQESAYLKQTLQRVYAVGILSIEDAGMVQKQGFSRITVVNSKHQGEAYPLNDCFTPRGAYELLLAGSPEGEHTKLPLIGLNGLLLPNLTFDSTTTAIMHQKLLNEITEISGMIQQGEKIIDRGEIVDAATYQILMSLRRSMEEKGVDAKRAIGMQAGLILLFALLVSLISMYLFTFRPLLFSDVRSILFFCILMTIVIVMACLLTRYTTFSIYLVPFAWVPIITRVFYDSRTALYLHMITILICSFLAPEPFEFMVLQMAVGMLTVASLKDMEQRSQLFQTALCILATYAFMYTAFIFAQKGSIEMVHWQMYLYFAGNALLVICSYVLIYFFEKAFRLVSSVTLVELTNINSELMLEFAEKAPGSFQHSLQVSNLAMEAAKRIGANALLVRTGALYHDIGKMSAPQNFTENQQDGVNPLSKLSYVEAAACVLRHVSEGVRIAEEHRLPEVVVSFIRMHHGTSKTRYFYNSYKNAHPGEPVDDALFQYAGPKPNSKEAAVVMMADAVEARSRSMSEYTEESIRQMVEQMIGLQMADRQFEETPLTFHDIQMVKEVFIRKLISIYHHRIAYPELKEPHK